MNLMQMLFKTMNKFSNFILSFIHSLNFHFSSLSFDVFAITLLVLCFAIFIFFIPFLKVSIYVSPFLLFLSCFYFLKFMHFLLLQSFLIFRFTIFCFHLCFQGLSSLTYAISLLIEIRIVG